jgi:hypothetical protein
MGLWSYLCDGSFPFGLPPVGNRGVTTKPMPHAETSGFFGVLAKALVLQSNANAFVSPPVLPK